MLSNALFLIRLFKTYASLVPLLEPNFLHLDYTGILGTDQNSNNYNDYSKIKFKISLKGLYRKSISCLHDKSFEKSCKLMSSDLVIISYSYLAD